jgi:tetratricopeptide (TPR) repeat protein/transcriptional regulator with XRE-family HTH domain
VTEALRNASDRRGDHEQAVIMSTAEASMGSVAPGVWLKRQRKAAGLTQEDLAERSGVSVRTIADLERGRTRKPYPSSLRALVRALGLPEAAGTDLVARFRLSLPEPAADSLALATDSLAPATDSLAPVTDSLVPAIDSLAPATASPGPAIDSLAPAIDSLAPAEPVPRQLPTAVPYFTGRVCELRELDDQRAQLLADAADGARSRVGTVAITAIGGTAGVGKTALALHWAHQAVPSFPDGQLYANLRGFDSASTPTDPADILRSFLDALGVHQAQHPADLEGLAALYRGKVADRRMLVVLDNASDVAQVRPLLPASPMSLVIVTSRRELTALAAGEGARILNLDVLTEHEATDLLTARLGSDRIVKEPEAVRDLARLCARLPLALSVVVARAAAQPRLPLTSLTAELTEIQTRLDALDAGDPTANVRTVISLSDQHLSEPAARMFRLLGLHPGPDITAPAAASLAAVTHGQAHAALRELARASLIAEHVPGRYAFHDLLRSYAVEQALDSIPDNERADASLRSLSHYLHSAHAARLLLYPGHDTIRLDPPLPGVRPECFPSQQAALEWLHAEHGVLLQQIGMSAGKQIDDYAWRFPVVLWTYYYVCGYWHDGAATQYVAVEAARRRGERNGYARAMRGLGGALAQLGEYVEAVDWLHQAAAIFREVGDGVGLARTYLIIGQAYEYQGRYSDSLSWMDEALGLTSAAPGDPDMQLVRAAALNNCAWCRVNLGELEQARDRCLEAIELCRCLGYIPGEAGTFDTLGFVYQRLGEYAEAVRCYSRALELGAASGNRLLVANTLGHLAQTHRSAGDATAARAAWLRALDVYEDLRHRDADKVRGKIRELDSLITVPAG